MSSVAMRSSPSVLDTRAQIAAITERMRALCSTLQTYCPPSERHVHLETVRKWAREIDVALQRDSD